MKVNLQLKLLALALSLIIWLYVVAGDNTIDIRIPIRLDTDGLSPNLAMVTVIPDQVELQVEGPASRIRRIEDANQKGTLRAVLDLRRGAEGKREYPIRVYGAHLRWLSWETIPGKRLEVLVEAYAQTTVTPEQRIVGGLDPGTYIEFASGVPEEVTVRGAESLIGQLDRVVYRLSETDLIGFETVKVDFIPQTADGRYIPNLIIVPGNAEVDITVRKESASREVPVVYDFEGSPPAGFTVTDVNIDPLFITVHGPAEVLKDVTRIMTEPVDLGGHSGDFAIADLRLVLPEDPRISLPMETVALEVKIAHKTTTRKFEAIPIRWEGEQDLFLMYTAEPTSVDVTVSGPISAVSRLQREMIIAVVRVVGLAEGIHENRRVTVQISLQDISLVKIDPGVVTVRVRRREEFETEGDTE